MVDASPPRWNRIRTSSTWFDRRLWSQWVLANAAGELIGLGLAASLGIVLALVAEALIGELATVVIAVGMIALGTFEGAVVGAAQWIVLRRPLPLLGARTWIVATAIGALIAWSLGMIPSTAMEFGSDNGTPAGPDISPVLFFGLAAAMGAALGVVLAVAQWMILRRHVFRASVWLPANSLAWMLAMPVIFFGASSVPEGAGTLLLIGLVLVTVIVAGVIVGAIHGLALTWLVHQHHVPNSK